jgi:hypothetical protein
MLAPAIRPGTLALLREIDRGLRHVLDLRKTIAASSWVSDSSRHGLLREPTHAGKTG